jgi:hypothetical protein
LQFLWWTLISYKYRHWPSRQRDPFPGHKAEHHQKKCDSHQLMPFSACLPIFSLDVLAVLMSDECEKLFSSAKLLLTDRLSRLRMDIIEVCECLCAWYDPPPTKRLKRQQTSAKWIRGHMSLIVLTAHIVVIGNMEILMEICSRNRYVLLT